MVSKAKKKEAETEKRLEKEEYSKIDKSSRVVTIPEEEKSPVPQVNKQKKSVATAPPVSKREIVSEEKAPIEVEESVKKEQTPVPAIEEKPRGKTLKEGLKKTRGGFISKIGSLFSRKKEIDEEFLEELEEVLFTADIGPFTSENLLSHVKEKLDKKSLDNPDAVWSALREKSKEILDLPVNDYDFNAKKPYVILVVGVNGVGKTTSIGKLASRFKSEGKKVMLAAGDTFRAAAIEQLEVWATTRVGCDIAKGKEGADPSSVIFDAIKKAQAEDVDVLIADTAGRLHTSVNLMDELAKVRRTCDKAMSGAPHDTFLVLDATTGQNALHQADMFMKVMDFSGIIITKLDGTAKGGVILGICDKMKVPVKYIGIGEQVEDLRDFNAADFVEALYEKESDQE
ncbi:signal recognition particle-docking protein FtsY [Myxococcota bacterium]|nr:signal recognition particle-docking protein FtsY [Myxococcota bacterium]MBU1380797.1 signal recognition particle-docking protein FtsY [Myxococcota bacterium]MBU1498931.1 signal recognition particle-docking protein FtsY [Myxococcota bacterium]